jgi:glycosyltransferase involved in cell wall biosynthesis
VSERVSVVIPVYQGERFLAQAIETVLDQERTPEELIVVDDGSTDGSERIARSYPVTYLRQENAGVAAARNAGLAAATGDLIALLDQDDLWEPRKLRLQLACLRERPEVGWVTCRTRWLLEPGTPMPPWARPEWFEEPQVSFVTSAMLVRREVFDSVGRFDESYVVGSDTDWMVRARDAGVDSVTLEEVLVYHRLHGANNSYDLEMTSEETLRLIKSSLDRRRRSQSRTARGGGAPGGRGCREGRPIGS